MVSILVPGSVHFVLIQNLSLCINPFRLSFSVPWSRGSPGSSPGTWLSTFPLPWSWSRCCCSGLTKVWAGDHLYPSVFLLCWKDWTSVFVSDASCGKFSIPHMFFFSFFLPAFALMCLLCYWRIRTFLLFLCGHLMFSISKRHKIFSQDLNCMSGPFSPGNSELILPLALFEILVYPGNFPFWFVMRILGFSWNSQC